MIRLARVEVRRAFARKLIVIVMLAGVVGAAAMVASMAMRVRPLSGAELAAAEEQWEIAQEDWAENGEQYVTECEEAEALESEAAGEPMDFGCETMEPQREWFFMEPEPLSTALPLALVQAGYLVAFMALVIGATFTAAEFHTGAIGNWLTFEPRRNRVFASKVVAAAIAAIPVSLVLAAIIGLGTWFAYDLAGLLSDVPGGSLWAGLRAAALGPLFAAIGAALGMLLRHTGAVLGLVLVYVILVEGILFARPEWLLPWKVALNLSGFVQYGRDYGVNECVSDATGTTCMETTLWHSFAASAGYLVALTAVIVTVALLAFRRRDVS